MSLPFFLLKLTHIFSRIVEKRSKLYKCMKFHKSETIEKLFFNVNFLEIIFVLILFFLTQKEIKIKFSSKVKEKLENRNL